MTTFDIKVGGFYVRPYRNRIEYVTKITENTVYYETYSVYTGLKRVSCWDNKVYYTLAMRPISPAEIFLRYGNDPGIVEWVKNRREKNESK